VADRGRRVTRARSWNQVTAAGAPKASMRRYSHEAIARQVTLDSLAPLQVSRRSDRVVRGLVSLG
jgi:hypothetical protein